MKTLLIGTNNPSKLRVFEEYLVGLDIHCVTPASLGLQAAPDENQRSALGNAIEKARAWHHASGLPVITEDSGLVFLDLPKDHPDQPGVMVRRACGHTMDDEEMLAWYQAIIHHHGGQLRAAWEDAWCVLQDDSHYHTHVTTPEALERQARLMIDTPCAKRLPGWPLDSLTYFPDLGKYKAEITLNEIGQTLQTDCQELIDWLRRSVTAIL